MVGSIRYGDLNFDSDEGYLNRDYQQAAAAFCEKPTLLSMAKFLQAQYNISKDLINNVVTVDTIKDGSFEEDDKYKTWVSVRLNHDIWGQSLYRVFFNSDSPATIIDYDNCIEAFKASAACLKIYLEETYADIPFADPNTCVPDTLRIVKDFTQVYVSSIEDAKRRLNGAA